MMMALNFSDLYMHNDAMTSSKKKKNDAMTTPKLDPRNFITTFLRN